MPEAVFTIRRFAAVALGVALSALAIEAVAAGDGQAAKSGPVTASESVRASDSVGPGPLPAAIAGVAPGMFARVWLPTDKPDACARLFVPTSAVVRRAEMNTLYVVDAKGVPMLRLVRLGRAQGDQVEVLSGVSAGEQVALDPQAGARQP